MNTSQEHLDLIEQYLNGYLTDEEVSIFESRLEKEDDFKNLYADYIKSRKSINDAIKETLKKKVVQGLNKNKKSKTIWLKPLSIAAGFLIIVVGSIWVLTQDSTTPEQLFSEYYAPPPTPNMRSQDSAPNNQQAFIAYQNQNYVSADTLLEQLLELDDKNRKEELMLLYAGTLLELNRVDEAITQLNRINAASALFQDAQWYLLLSYLKSGNKEQAIKTANAILAVDKHFKTDEATRVLKSLN